MPRSEHIIAPAMFVTLLAMGSACDEPAPDLASEPTGQAAAEDEETEPPAHAPVRGPTRGRTVYVPAYSHLGTPGGRETLLAVTLSVRNVDPSATVRLTRVDYYDTSGHRVRRYLRSPRTLQPLETAEFSVETLDEAGGSGANFLVYWEGPADAHPLLTETVMVGHDGVGVVSFTSRGVELERPPELPGETVESSTDPAR